ncbi:MAG: SGNH/GDSL hydrolase family protein [Pseudomonadota bacterium]
MVLIALGVNDVKNGWRSKTWEAGYRALLMTVAEKFGQPRMCVSGMRPLRHFPLLPSPLSDVLGIRAERFDAILQQIAAERSDTVHLSMEFPLERENMASDGFHPSAKVYREWAERAATVFDHPLP